MATPQITDPYREFRFRLELSGIQIAAFSDATLPSIPVKGIDVRKGPARTHSYLTLRKGLSDSVELHQWQQQAMARGADGQNVRRNVSLRFIGADGMEVARWNIVNAWPTKYETSGLNAASGDVAVLTLELALECMNRVK